jgi:hypothetical protein
MNYKLAKTEIPWFFLTFDKNNIGVKLPNFYNLDFFKNKSQITYIY